ncbi:DUF3455 domain-containing protein [Lentzea sp. DG1S-22]|uniref:DUF3455 domain-containing protein n=1 Tax=Lentzea sp. DG1S-22 TaxID=3108822 RepID=UPI002E779539|nr:DUF3455 domain-containing protein [Lentzea sp. DG1S-22]WVH85000.1 DUF3455 domain-containing protein [Lentzea sp. DG1S-22]
MRRAGLFVGTAALLCLAACGTSTAGTATPSPVAQAEEAPVAVAAAVTEDGSAVEAAPVDGAENDVTGAVPELLLKTRTARGGGLFGKVTYVQRLQTEGGVAPSGGCKACAQTSAG